MSKNAFQNLPLDSLYELLTESVTNMLVAFESTEDYKATFKPLKKHIEMLITAIEGKRKEIGLTGI